MNNLLSTVREDETANILPEGKLLFVSLNGNTERIKAVRLGINPSTITSSDIRRVNVSNRRIVPFSLR